MYSACLVLCVRGTEGHDSTDFSCKIPRATLNEDENTARFRSGKVQKAMVFAQYANIELLRRILRKREGAWPDLNPVQKYCFFQVEEGVANEAQR